MPNEWQTVLDEIKDNVSDTAFKTYFGNVKFELENGTVNIIVRSAFIKAQIQNKYINAVKKALKTANIKYKDIIVIIRDTRTQQQESRSIEISKIQPKIPKPARSTPKNLNDDSTGLNPAYRLSNYVVGKNNDVAVSAAKAVIDNPGKLYNPYFIYGGSGLGKTHLIQAIGNEIHERYPELKVRYVTIQEFYGDFVDSIRRNLEGFKEKYRKVDVLIVDDFQYIVNKEKSQEEFFHTFNDLYRENKQVIVSSDRLPSQIETVDPRLATRLTMGIPIDIQMPGFEERCAIIQMKAELLGAEIDNTTVEYLAKNINTNIRDLEGELHRILVMADLRGVPTSKIIEEMTPISRPGKPRLSSRQLIERVAKYYNLSSKDLLGTSRMKDIKNARQVAMYLMREELGLSTVKIGLEFSKDHTTIMHGIKVIEANLKSNFSFREQVSELRNKLYVS